ncbi:MAG: CotH kinase family protein [Bacteroidota bacterium]|nr:CotH kinase family protein [Bacteroidota bacterium]
MTKLPLTFFFFLSGFVLKAQIAINEFNCVRGYTDEFGDDLYWIEIHNFSNDSVLLSQYYLSDNPDNLDKWQFPNNYLGSKEIFTICASGRENMRLPNHWESLVIAEDIWKYWLGSAPPTSNWDNWNTLAFNDQNWDSGQGGIGYGDNDDNTIINVTPSLYLRKEFQITDVNNITQLLFHADYDDGFIAYLNGIEIMRSANFNSINPGYAELTNANHEAVLYNGGIPESKFFNSDEVTELLVSGNNILAVQVHNASATSSDMSGNFFLSAGIASTTFKYQPLPSWIIPPTINAHASFKLSHGETIIISDTSKNILDSISIPENITNSISYGRIPDGLGSWCYFNSPSPNILNDQNFCFSSITQEPTTDFFSGWYPYPFHVNISTAPNTTTYYTTNGDIPDTDDLEVNGQIYINSSTVLSLKSFSNSGQEIPSRVVDRTYIINEENHNLPVFSIITDEDNLWDWNTGIYVSGPNAGTSYPFFGSNFWEPWSRKSRMEFFDGSKTKRFGAEFDLEIHGGWSRAQPQKSFRIDAKSTYTGDIEYALISKKPHITQYNNFNLRNGGQHNYSSRIQDALISRLAKNTHIDRMGYEPCIVYLNGEYWGLYGIREKIDEHYVESNHGIDNKKVDLLNKDGVLAGSADHFSESYYLIMSANPNNNSFIEIFKSRFDINNYIDYFIFQTYIQNQDWLGIAWGLNNIKLWRPDSLGGKWRYVLYDTDGAFGHFGQNTFANYLYLARNPSVTNAHSQIFNHALYNGEFKCRFTNRYNDLINTTFQTSNFNAVSLELKENMEDAIPDHINRWSSQVGPNSLNQWENAINGISQYNSSRITTARQHINQTLSLQGQRLVNLDAYPAESGSIKVNSIKPNLPWNGIYHGGCPVDLKATPNKGYIFSHWYSTVAAFSNLKTDSIQVNLPLNTNFVAHFDTCENVIDVDVLAQNNRLIPSTSEELSIELYSWELNGNVISTDSIIYNPIDGNYTLTIQFDSCEIESNVYVVENGTYNVLLYPNPTIDVLNIQFLIGQQQDVTIRMINTIGQVMREETLENFIGQYNKSIDASLYSKGAYFIQVITPNKMYSEKFILTE